ncbi:hypothetical protein NQ314_019639 [Rhamnusium bicolor]|uniref:Uncharacterized protein n=1 Tax=Rhamnusium bicolor TaxID=1586634 RepID=A0AAV8WNT8_9CUCU|nr:hypothetical protein NQ314_019639 [Rhamnusium bicolor]
MLMLIFSCKFVDIPDWQICCGIYINNDYRSKLSLNSSIISEIFDICSNDGEPIHRDVYQCLLSYCKLSSAQLKTICDLTGTPQGYVNRTNLYKTLALVAWAQQGKHLSDKLFDNCVGKDQSQIAVNSQNIRTLVNIIGKLKHLTEASVEHQNALGRDFDDFAVQLKSLSTLNMAQGQNFIENWDEMQRGFGLISRELKSLSAKSVHHADAEQLTICERLGLLLDILVAHKELCDRLDKGLHHDHAIALGTDAESVENLESKMLTQESVITNMELRSNFSLYCVHMETQLVYAYLGTLSSILNKLVALKIKSHSELHDIWKQVQPFAQQCSLHDVFSNGMDRRNTCSSY